MGSARVNSFPELAQAFPTPEQLYDDSALEGVAAHVKLLLKLIKDHKEACGKEKNDGRRMLRVATMITILDTIRTRIQNCQSFGKKKAESKLKRCSSDLKPPKERRFSGELVVNEKERLRRELSASMAARKSLEIMCSSLGKEKEIMAAELSRKVQELNGMEELLHDLKAQNDMLLEKVQECALEHKGKKRVGLLGETQGSKALKEQNDFLSEQLLRSIDGYRSVKRKLKEVQEENAVMRSKMDEMEAEIGTSLARVQRFKDHVVSSGDDPTVDIKEEIVGLEKMFQCFQMMAGKHDQKKGERINRVSNACNRLVIGREEEVI